jgi:hypothetical protein
MLETVGTYNVASNSAFNCGYKMMINRKTGMYVAMLSIVFETRPSDMQAHMLYMLFGGGMEACYPSVALWKAETRPIASEKRQGSEATENDPKTKRCENEAMRKRSDPKTIRKKKRSETVLKRSDPKRS